MKQTVLFGLAVLFMLNLTAQETPPYLVKNYSGVKRVKASTAGGNISVKGGDVKEANVKVYIRASNSGDKLSDAEIKQRLDADYTLKMEMEGDQLVLQAKNKNNINWKKGLSISFAIEVPRATANELTTSGGNIQLQGVEGKQNFTTSGGNLSVVNVKGDIKGVTSGGNIHAEGLTNNIDLTTSGGNIGAEDCKGTIRLTTSGGNLNLEDLEGTIDASTSGGNVSAENLKGEIDASTSGGNVGMENIRGSLKAGTSGGHLRVSMDEVGKYVKLNNSGGNISLELPAGKGYDLDIRGSKVETESLSNYSGSMSSSKLNGKLNGGGVPVTVDNSGRVNLSFHK